MDKIIEILNNKFNLDPIRDSDIIITYFAMAFWGIVLFIIYEVLIRAKNQQIKIPVLVVFVTICFHLTLFDKQGLVNSALQKQEIETWGNFTDQVRNLKELNNILHVMSYNLRAAGIDITYHHWENRKKIAADLIMDQQFVPDVIGTQEGFDYQLDFITKYINSKDSSQQFEWFGNEANSNNRNYDSAVIYNNKTLKKIESETIWLSDKPEIKFSKISDSKGVRTCTYAYFQHRDSNKTFLFFNVHLDHFSEIARQKQSEILLNYIREKKQKYNESVFLITGDFNTMRDSFSYKQIIQSDSLQVQDLWSTNAVRYPKNDTKFTFHLFLGHKLESVFYKFPISFLINMLAIYSPSAPFVRNPSDFHIDFLFIGTFEAKKLEQIVQNDVKIFKIWQEGKQLDFSDRVMYPSDHYPISSFISLQNF